MKSLSKKLAVNISSNWLSMLCSGIIELITVPVALHALGMTGYGVWALLAFGLSYLTILEAAFALTVNRFSAYYKDDHAERNRHISVSFFGLTGFAILGMAAGLAVSGYIPRLFPSIPPEFAAQAKVTFILVVYTLAAKMVESTFSGVLTGNLCHARANIVRISASFLRLVLMVVGLKYWPTIISVQVAFAVAVTLQAILMYFVMKKSVPGIVLSLGLVTLASAKKFTSYVIHSITRSGSRVFMETTLVLMVGVYGKASDVAIYNVASRLPGLLQSLLACVQNVFLPVATTFAAKGQIQGLHSVVRRGTAFCAALTGITAIWLYAFAQPLLSFWLRKAPSADEIAVMRVVLLALISGGIFELWLPVLVAMGRLKWLSISAIAASVAGLALNYLLLRYRLVPMAIAPAIALLTVWILKTGIWLPLYGTYELKLGRWDYFSGSLGLPVLAALVAIPLAWLTKFLPVGGLIWQVLVMGVTGVAITIVFTLIALRKELMQAVSSIRHRNQEKQLESSRC